MGAPTGFGPAPWHDPDTVRAVDGHPPSVDALARRLPFDGLPDPLRIDAARASIQAGAPDEVERFARAIDDSMLRPVVNATGVLLHTNLGRAPFAVAVDARYANVELDLATGERGERRTHAGALLARACGADAALVVNNGAAAVLLVLAALARDRPVAVSRGELVEIGGGFRVPDVMAQSGAILREVGTTNRTRAADYAAAISERTALILRVHPSNFKVVGFTERPRLEELTALGPVSYTHLTLPKNREV